MWLDTTVEVYAVIMARHRDQLEVHSSFSDLDGLGYEFSSGRPEMVTEWGFKNADFPLLRLTQIKGSRDQEKWDNKYEIYVPQETNREFFNEERREMTLQELYQAKQAYYKDWSEEEALAAVKQDGYALRFVRNQTEMRYV
jgi:hypothetical protein